MVTPKIPVKYWDMPEAKRSMRDFLLYIHAEYDGGRSKRQSQKPACSALRFLRSVILIWRVLIRSKCKTRCGREIERKEERR
jgi:hypothetical protein